MLVGIVLRGSAFTFRTYDDEHDAAQRRWGRIFASASVVTPVLLGICMGAVASGRVGGPLEGSFADRFVDPWLNPFALGVGILTLALFAFLAAVFLTLESHDPELCEDFRRRALAGVAVFSPRGWCCCSMGGEAAHVPWPARPAQAVPIHLATGLRAGVLAALYRHCRLARVLAAGQACSSSGWALAQYPYLVPPDLTVAGAAAPAVTLQLVLIGLALGAGHSCSCRRCCICFGLQDRTG
jgi:cytochrome d ubiquinol oxidase subunit II